MLFNSLQFALFLPVVVALAWMLRRSHVLRLAFLLAASYGFYMCWNWRYAGLLVGSTLLDFLVALQLARGNRAAVRKCLLVVSLAGNLGVLFYFKYFNFLYASAVDCATFAGWSLPRTAHDFLLPVGISFYTFQSLSYTIDVYRGKLQPTNSFIRFALFVSFFPQLVAGPIVRASEFLPQLQRAPVFDDRRAQRGLYLIALGLFKKICIADVLAATLLDRVYANPDGFGTVELLLAAYGYTFQIYCDFSGYSDIAIGAAALLGYELPINFNRPFLATSLRDFWRRWHISLSSWLRDYLYVPLGGNRGSRFRTQVNLMITMLLGGLWHGANWTFVIWGALHGAYLAIERALGIAPLDDDAPRSRVWVRRLITFHLVVVAFLIFRCDDVSVFWAFLSGLMALAPATESIPVLFVIAMAAGVVTHVSPPRWGELILGGFLRQPAYRQGAVLAACMVLYAALSVPQAPFIYFQF